MSSRRKKPSWRPSAARVASASMTENPPVEAAEIGLERPDRDDHPGIDAVAAIDFRENGGVGLHVLLAGRQRAGPTRGCGSAPRSA